MSSQPWCPHPYQTRAVEFCLERGAAGLFLDPGLGKTSAMLKVLQHTPGPHLVLSPLRVARHVWRQEAAKWRDFTGLRVSLLHGDHKDDRLRDDADIYLCNFEGLAWLTGVGRLKKKGFKTLVVDESSKMKSSDTQRFRMLKPYLPQFERRYILTGSPAPNSLYDLWAQIFLLDLGKSLSPFVTHFQRMFFQPHPSGWGWMLRPGMEEEIYSRIAPLVLRLSAAEYLQLPERVTQTVWVDLPESARDAYTSMEQEFFAQLDGGMSVEASAKGGALAKCWQISNGAIYTDFQRKQWQTLHDAKLTAVQETLEEIGGQPTMVAYQFRHDLARLRALLGAETPALPARSAREEDDIIARWNAGEIPTLLTQKASVSHGMNLQGAAHHMIDMALGWNYDDDDQWARRLQRQGQTHSSVIVHRIATQHTLDEVMLRGYTTKGAGQDALLQYCQEYRHQ